MRLLSTAFVVLAAVAPAATANHQTFDCGFNAIANETVTGGQDTFTGIAYGYITAPEEVSIRCFIQVDGSEAASTSTAAGNGAASTASQVTYTAADFQSIELCAEWRAGWESGTTCDWTTSAPVPPEAVVDALISVIDLVVDVVSDVPGGGGDPTVGPGGISYNDGETGLIVQNEIEELTARRGPADAHDLSSSCIFKISRHTGLITVIGKTKAGRHPTASTVSIRCRLEDATTGAVLFDQTRTEPGTLARLEGTTAANPDSVRLCNRGEGFWGDDHTIVVGLTCKNP